MNAVQKCLLLAGAIIILFYSGIVEVTTDGEDTNIQIHGNQLIIPAVMVGVGIGLYVFRNKDDAELVHPCSDPGNPDRRQESPVEDRGARESEGLGRTSVAAFRRLSDSRMENAGHGGDWVERRYQRGQDQDGPPTRVACRSGSASGKTTRSP